MSVIESKLKKSILIIGTVWPEPFSSAAGARMLQIIKAFQKEFEDIEITFASASITNEHSFDLNSIGVKTQSIQLNNSSFDEFVKELQPSIVVFDRFMTEEQYGWRVNENCPEALLILDTEDLHFLRKAREKAWKRNIPFEAINFNEEQTLRELASIYRCDISLIISEVELELLTLNFNIPMQLLYELPFMLPAITNEWTSSLPSFEKRNHFIFIGNFWHEPNYNAVLYLKERIWPLIRKELTKAELHVYGAYGSQKVEQLHNEKEGFIYKGRAENAYKVIKQAKVLLAPLRFGAGLKGKLIDAMVCGTPHITTSIGAEGMFKNLAIPGFISDNELEFAKNAIQTYQKQTLWNEFQTTGFKVINELYEENSLSNKFTNHIKDYIQNLNHYRNQNFIGNLLKMQSLNSTKYFSKWIEEKNKKKCD